MLSLKPEDWHVILRAENPTTSVETGMTSRRIQDKEKMRQSQASTSGRLMADCFEITTASEVLDYGKGQGEKIVLEPGQQQVKRMSRNACKSFAACLKSLS